MEKSERERAQSQSGLHLWWSNPENGAWTKFWNGKTRVCLTRAGANWAQVSIRTPCSHKGNFPMIWLTSFRHASGIFFTGEMSGESSVGKQPYYDCCLENSVRNPHLLLPRNKDKAERVGSFFVRASRETIMSGKKLRKQSPDRETSSVPSFASSLSSSCESRGNARAQLTARKTISPLLRNSIWHPASLERKLRGVKIIRAELLTTINSFLSPAENYVLKKFVLNLLVWKLSLFVCFFKNVSERTIARTPIEMFPFWKEKLSLRMRQGKHIELCKHLFSNCVIVIVLITFGSSLSFPSRTIESLYLRSEIGKGN